MVDAQRASNEPDKNVYCGAPYPKGELFCVKPPGHQLEHCTLLGIHPEHEDGHGVLWPAQEEWDFWPVEQAS